MILPIQVFVRACCAALFLLLPALPLAAQNLLANGSFPAGTDLNGWTPLGPGPWSANWDAEDANGVAGSGSVLLSNTSSQAGFRAQVLRQCLSAPLRGVYRFVLSGRVPSGQTRTGYSLLEWTQRYNGPNCVGGIQGGGGQIFATPDAWERKGDTIIFYSTPVAGSIEVLLSLEKTEAGGLFRSRLDEIVLDYDSLLWADFEVSP